MKIKCELEIDDKFYSSVDLANSKKQYSNEEWILQWMVGLAKVNKEMGGALISAKVLK